jgi:hypothetical protein
MGDRSRLSLMLAALAVSTQLGCCHALNNGVGLAAPLMGVVNYVNRSNDELEPAARADWHPRYVMNETAVSGLVDAIASNGLRKKGYAFIPARYTDCSSVSACGVDVTRPASPRERRSGRTTASLPPSVQLKSDDDDDGGGDGPAAPDGARRRSREGKAAPLPRISGLSRRRVPLDGDDASRLG